MHKLCQVSGARYKAKGKVDVILLIESSDFLSQHSNWLSQLFNDAFKWPFSSTSEEMSHRIVNYILFLAEVEIKIVGSTVAPDFCFFFWEEP